MLAEAASKFSLPLQGLAHRLTRRRDLIGQLSAHREVLTAARAAGAQIQPVTAEHLEHAAELAVRHQLLTNDAVLLAVGLSLGISHLATNDDDFDAIPGLTVWKPR
jgi:predicted nucleic acid-binding protein